MPRPWRSWQSSRPDEPGIVELPPGVEAPQAAEPDDTPAGAWRIADAFAVAHGEHRPALMPYMMGGFPDREGSAAVAAAYASAGADLVELGVPFSDPLADGPVIHDAATRALAAGATLESVLRDCERIGRQTPVVVMAYVNMVLARGPSEFAAALADAGAAGAIVPDLPLGEAPTIAPAFREAGLAFVPLVAPTTPADRRAEICAAADGFVYVVSDTRTTGERDELPSGLSALVESVKAEATVPAAVGFGIGTPTQAAAVGQLADGVIIGSRLVRMVSEAGSADDAASDVSSFIRECRERMSGGDAGAGVRREAGLPGRKSQPGPGPGGGPPGRAPSEDPGGDPGELGDQER